MITTQQRIANLSERRQAVQKELADLAENRPGSDNTALADLEAALTTELDKIEQQIRQLQTYMNHVQPGSDAGR